MLLPPLTFLPSSLSPFAAERHLMPWCLHSIWELLRTRQKTVCVTGAGRQAEGVVCGPRAAAQRNAAGSPHSPDAPAPGVCG